MKKISVILLFFVFFVCSILNADGIYYREEKNLIFSFGLGFNTPIKGYAGYLNNPVLSAKVDIKRQKALRNLNYRFSIDYFIMIVPKETYGITEDIINFSSGLTYKLIEIKNDAHLYAGFGLSYSLDTVKINTIALKKSHTYSYFGCKASLGMRTYINENILLMPEITVHTVFDGFATNLCFSINIGI